VLRELKKCKKGKLRGQNWTTCKDLSCRAFYFEPNEDTIEKWRHHLWGITLFSGNCCRASHTRTWFREDIVWVKTDGASVSSACRWTGQCDGRCVFDMLITRKLVITPFCVDNKLENTVTSPKDVISLLISSTWSMITRNQLIILFYPNNMKKQEKWYTRQIISLRLLTWPIH